MTAPLAVLPRRPERAGYRVGEVSVGIWPEAMQDACAKAGIPLL